MKNRLMFKSNILNKYVKESSKILDSSRNVLDEFYSFYEDYYVNFEKSRNYNKGCFFEDNEFNGILNRICKFYLTKSADDLVLQAFKEFDFKNISELKENLAFMEDEKKLVNDFVDSIYEFFFTSKQRNFYQMAGLLNGSDLQMISKHAKGETIVKVIGKRSELLYKIPEKLNPFRNLTLVDIKDDIFEKEDFSEYRKASIDFARRAVTYSYSIDDLIIKKVEAIEDMERVIEQMSKRLKDLLAIIDFDLSLKETDVIISRVLEQDYSNNRVGMHSFDPKDIERLASSIKENKDALENLLESLELEMTTNYPNITYVAGAKMAAKLISLSGSFFNLFIFPSSTIQLLGAESALFRHLVSKAKPPKHGIIINHPLLVGAKSKGKMARKLASLISLASKFDYAKSGLQIKERYEKLRKERI